MSKKVTLLVAACLIPLIACFVLSNIRCGDSGDSTKSRGLREERESLHSSRALIAANFTEQAALNDTLAMVAAPVSGQQPAPAVAPNSPPAEPTPAAVPTHESPSAGPTFEVPATPNPTECTPSVAYSPVTSPSPSPSTAPSKVPADKAPDTRNAGPLVVPILDCVLVRSSSEYRVYLSYENKNPDQVSVPVGKNNKFTAPTDNLGQPTVFAPGRSSYFPASIFTTTLSQASEWQLTNYVLMIDPEDTEIHCEEEINLVVQVTTTVAPNNSFVDTVTQVVANQFNVSVALINITVTHLQGDDYEVHIVVKPPPERLEEIINTAKEIISDTSLIEEPLKQLVPDVEVISVRGSPNTDEKQGVFITSPSLASRLVPFWTLLLVFLVNL
jgi:hypothetical protein